MHHNQSSRLDIKTPATKQQQKKYKYRELLTHLQCCTKAPLSYKEQAEMVGCSKFFAKKIAKQNLSNGIIIITPTTHESSGRKLAGKNIYGRGENFDPRIHLINNLNFSIEKSPIINVMFEKKICQKSVLIRKFVEKDGTEIYKKPKKFTTNKNYKRNLDKSKFAKDKQPETSKNYITKDQKIEVLKAYGFEPYAEKAPIWWFRAPARLKAALRLLKAKLKRGFKPKNFYKFVTFLMKRGTFGYRRHCARELSVAVVQPNTKNSLKFCMSEPIEKTYLGMKELYAKHNLNLSFKSVEKLLRNKFPRLTAAVSVCLTRISWASGDEIRDANAFLNYLVGMNNPFDYLKNKNGYI